jgi:2-keto-4-pentenoate hydratase/2-oxohepta-3-ene-1,7-dioic acid hydratase (catechol pathway)
MKYVSFLNNKKESFGILLDQKIVDLTMHYEQYRQGMEWIPCLKSAIEDNKISDLNNLDLNGLPEVNLNDVKMLPVIPNPGKIFCIGLNYENHRAETKRPESQNPTIFTRFAESQTGHGDNIICPKVSDKLNYEGEMAIIIGKSGRNIEEKNAMDHVAGYAC